MPNNQIQRTPEVERYVDLPYRIEYELEEDEAQVLYFVSHPELPGCVAQGATYAEAVASLAEARADYIATLLEDGLEVPLPKGSGRVTSVAVVSSAPKLRRGFNIRKTLTPQYNPTLQTC